MFSTRNLMMGMLAGTLVSTAIVPVVSAADKQTYNLLDGSGNPVLTSREEECVQTPGTPNDPTNPFKQCGDIMDSDGDGVPDDEDFCPDNTARQISRGVYDDASPLRREINQAPRFSFDRIGCPVDSDSDGVANYVPDECPGTPRIDRKYIDSRGCLIDDDMDGVPDYRDLCLNTRPEDRDKVNEDGCARSVGTKVEEFPSDVLFAFDSFTLNSRAQRTLDAVVDRVNREGRFFHTMIVIGHTDSIGTDAYNQRLSEQRAKAVADYLASRGIPGNQISFRGMGESQPKATNRTAAGRADNRRVVLLIELYYRPE